MRRRMWSVAALGVAVLAVAVLALVVQRPAGDRPAAGGPPVHSVTGALRGQQEAQFEVVGGAESVIIHSTDLDGYLYVASTLPGSSVVPRVAEIDDRVELRLAGTAVAGQATVHVQLHSKVRWRLRLAGGGLQQIVDFGTGRLAGIELLSGAGEVELSLPTPEGTVPIRLLGSAGRVAIHAPAGQPAQVRLGASATAGVVVIDGQSRPGLGSGATFTPADWTPAADRYDIEANAAVASLTVDRR